MVTDGIHRRGLKRTVVQDLIVGKDGRLHHSQQIKDAEKPADIAFEERPPVPLNQLGCW